jgi:hypothetical protein
MREQLQQTLFVITFAFSSVFFCACDTDNTITDPTDKYFVKFYGGDGDHDGVDLVSLNDGSFILVGNAKVPGSLLGRQIYIVKVSTTGMVIWEKTIGSTGDDSAKDIELTPDGRIVIAGETWKSAQERDVYVKTLTTEGLPLDSVRIGLKTTSNEEGDEEVHSITLITDGFIVSGSTTAVKTLKSDKPNDVRDGLHLRFTNSLQLVDPLSGQWSNTSGLDDSDDVIVKIIQEGPSLYYGFGYTNTIRNNSRDYKYWAFSLGATGLPSNNGIDLLDRIGSTGKNEFLCNVIESPVQAGEGFVLSGLARAINNDSDQAFIVKLQKTLFVPGDDNVLAEQTPIDLGSRVVGLDNALFAATSMCSLSQGGYLLLSNSNAVSNQAQNISLIKLSNTFLKVWQVPLFFGGVGNDFAGSVFELPDQKIVIIGTMTLGSDIGGQKKMVLIKLNTEGRLSE